MEPEKRNEPERFRPRGAFDSDPCGCGRVERASRGGLPLPGLPHARCGERLRGDVPGVKGAGATEAEALAALTQALRAHGRCPTSESQTENPPAPAFVR